MNERESHMRAHTHECYISDDEGLLDYVLFVDRATLRLEYHKLKPLFNPINNLIFNIEIIFLFVLPI